MMERVSALRMCLLFASLPGIGALLVGCSLMAPPDSELIGGVSSTTGGTTGFGGSAGSGGNGGTTTGSGASAGSPIDGMGGLPNAGVGGAPPDPPEPCNAPSSPSTEFLSLWLRADSGVDTKNNRVTSWASPAFDAVPAYTLTQAVTTMAPVLGQPLLGKAPPTFDGIDDSLANGEDHDFTSQAGYSFFAVVIPAATDSEGEILSITGPDGKHLGLWKAGNALEFGTNDAASAKLLTQNIFDGGQPVLIEVVSSRPVDAALVVSTYVNGVKQAASAAPAWDYDTEVGFSLGAYDSNSTGFAGAIGEVLIYKEGLDEATRFGTEAYLLAKWGLCQ